MGAAPFFLIELLDAARAHFAAHGASRLVTPERLRVVDALPRGAMGKVQRVELAQRMCE